MKNLCLVLCFLGISTMPALADVSDPGNLTIGGQAVIGGTMTVQGNAFSVGAATRSVFSVNGAEVYVGTGMSRSTFTAEPGGADFAVRLSSGIRVGGGGQIELTTGGGIKWAGGTMSGPYQQGASSVAYFQSAEFYNTSFSTNYCVATITLTTNGISPLRIGASGMWNNSLGNYSILNVFQDNSPIAPYTTEIGMLGDMGMSGAYNYDLALNVLVPAPSAGSHTYCLIPRVTSSGGNLGCQGTGKAACQFSVMEER